jgi:peptidoglycan hydrolase-like protein with peptidoglycan-binding domain
LLVDTTNVIPDINLKKPAPLETSTVPASVKLKFGDTGTEVAKLQQRLLELSLLASSDIDGKFGKKTKAAVEAFQRTKDLSPDGMVGPKTRAYLLK